VFAQGSIVDPDQAEWALAEGLADGVEMTRAQIADPDLGVRLATGQAERVRPCLLCNQRCQVRDNRNPLVSCVVEPRSGHEWEDPDPVPTSDADPDAGPAAAPGERTSPGPAGPAGPALVGRAEPVVLVVGGGPAGLECARVAAGNGRRVVVAERDQLGGWARRASRARGRERLVVAAEWLESECRRLGVRLDVGRSVGPDEAAAHDGPVVVCSGGVDRPPPELGYEVTPGARLMTAAQLVTALADPGAPRPEGPVAVWDPVGGPVGVSLAEELAARGRATTLVTPDPVVGTLLALTGDLPAANVRLHQAGVRLVKRAQLRRVEADRLVLEDRFGAGRSDLAVSLLVDAGHRLPDPSPWPERAPRAGDAVAPRSIHEAVLEGRRAALHVVGRAPDPSETSALPGSHRLQALAGVTR
jgi:2,4-dienoyl-CoA reductase (NADPH2)